MGAFISWIKKNLPADDREGSANTPPQSAWGEFTMDRRMIDAVKRAR